MTDNALDPPPVRRRRGQVPYPKIAAIVTGVVIVAGLVFVIGHIMFSHPALQGAPSQASFGRSGSSAPAEPPPAVPPAQAAQASANLKALQQAANSPALAARPGQVATVSPPAGPAPNGVGVVPARVSVGPAAA